MLKVERKKEGKKRGEEGGREEQRRENEIKYKKKKRKNESALSPNFFLAHFLFLSLLLPAMKYNLNNSFFPVNIRI